MTFWAKPQVNSLSFHLVQKSPVRSAVAPVKAVTLRSVGERVTRDAVVVPAANDFVVVIDRAGRRGVHPHAGFGAVNSGISIS
jgi:hypothetical protein